MIVRSEAGRLLLIRQPDHAHLSETVMKRCVPLSARSRRASILHAIGEHDNGWAEEDASPLVDPATGGVPDFVGAPLNVRHRVWPRAVARLAGDPWAGALVAQHAITIYERYRPEAAWTPFFAEMERMRHGMLGASGLPLNELEADYVFVRLGDLVSLTFCTGWTDEQRSGAWTVRLSGTRVGVTPDAFGGATIPMEIAAREIPNRRYESDAELREALGAANRTMLHGEVGAGTLTPPGTARSRSPAG
jgi:hypothetical protein